MCDNTDQEIRGGAKLYEIPVARAHDRPFNFLRRAATLREVKHPIHRNDRGRAVQQPKNDPKDRGLRHIDTREGFWTP